MFQCDKCQSLFLRNKDADICSRKEMESPLINVGRILIDDSYEVKNEIRCYAIHHSGHELVYDFEWRDPAELNEKWERVYSIRGNNSLIGIYQEQIT